MLDRQLANSSSHTRLVADEPGDTARDTASTVLDADLLDHLPKEIVEGMERTRQERNLRVLLLQHLHGGLIHVW